MIKFVNENALILINDEAIKENELGKENQELKQTVLKLELQIKQIDKKLQNQIDTSNQSLQKELDNIVRKNLEIETLKTRINELLNENGTLDTINLMRRNTISKLEQTKNQMEALELISLKSENEKYAKKIREVETRFEEKNAEVKKLKIDQQAQIDQSNLMIKRYTDTITQMQNEMNGKNNFNASLDFKNSLFPLEKISQSHVFERQNIQNLGNSLDSKNNYENEKIIGTEGSDLRSKRGDQKIEIEKLIKEHKESVNALMTKNEKEKQKLIDNLNKRHQEMFNNFTIVKDAEINKMNAEKRELSNQINNLTLKSQQMTTNEVNSHEFSKNQLEQQKDQKTTRFYSQMDIIMPDFRKKTITNPFEKFDTPKFTLEAENTREITDLPSFNQSFDNKHSSSEQLSQKNQKQLFITSINILVTNRIKDMKLKSSGQAQITSQYSYNHLNMNIVQNKKTTCIQESDSEVNNKYLLDIVNRMNKHERKSEKYIIITPSLLYLFNKDRKLKQQYLIHLKDITKIEISKNSNFFCIIDQFNQYHVLESIRKEELIKNILKQIQCL